MLRPLCAALAFAAVAGCGKEQMAQNNRDTMTQRQKDSVLAQSELPGARGVGQVQAQSDSAKARQARLDSIANSP